MLYGTIGGTSSVRETDILLTEDQCSSVLTAMPTRRNVIVVDIVVVRSTGNTSITALEKLEQHPGREVRPLYLGCISFLFHWRDLWGVGPTDGRLGGNVSPSLPNITGDLDSYSVGSYEPPQGAFKGYTAGDSVVENCAGAAYHYKTAAEGGEGCLFTSAYSIIFKYSWNAIVFSLISFYISSGIFILFDLILFRQIYIKNLI